MSEEHLPVLEQTIQQTNVWLKTLAEHYHFETRQHAYSALRAVLHSLRDRLVPEQAVHFGAELPILVRGIYYEGWRLSDTPTSDRQVQDFADTVMSHLPPNFPRDPVGTTEAVFDLLAREIDPGVILKVRKTMPEPLRGLWPGWLDE